MNLVDKVLALHGALADAGISHAFGGALALAYCTGQPRATIDVDLNVFAKPSSATTVFGALPDGVAWTKKDVAAVDRDGQVRLLWDRNPVDLFFSTDVFHDEAARRVRHLPLAGAVLPVIACSDLAVFKVFFDRTKDWADLEAMADVGALDREVVPTVEVLLGTDDHRTARLRQLLG